MKTSGLIFAVMLAAIVSCNTTTTEEVQKIKNLAQADSMKAAQASQKDSLITSYLNDLNDIQENLDRIKEREKIITMNPSEMNPDDKQTVVAELKELDNWIVMNDRKMNGLELRLRRMDNKNSKLESLVSHLTQEVAEKDEEIEALQAKLSKASDSIKLITMRFDDSIVVIRKQRATISALNTVYYITGTMKQLQEKGVINRQGGFVGLGRVASLNGNADNSMFTKVNLNNLTGINLHGKFRRLITTHPDKAYEIITNGKTDSIAITMPSTFWSESKYLVVAIK